MSRTERAALCDLALQVGEDQPTLCGGWTVKDLVVHLLLRERSPLAAGIVVPQLAGLTERAMERMKRGTDFTVLVERLRGGPPALPVPGEDRGPAQHGRVLRPPRGRPPRRSRLGAAPAERGGGVAAVVADPGARPGLTRGAPVGVVLERSDTGERAALKDAPATVVVRGLPSELTLFVYGRMGQARVELDGSDADVAALTGTDLGV